MDKPTNLAKSARYNELFAGKVPVVTQRPDRTSVFAQYTVFVDDREAMQEKLKQGGIPTAVNYPVPLHLQPAYRDGCRVHGGVDIAERMAQRLMSLPMSADLDCGQVELVVEAAIR